MRCTGGWLPALAVVTGLGLLRAAAAADVPQPPPSSALLLAVDYVIVQDSLTGVKSREDWERVAADALRSALPEVLADRAGMRIVGLPALEDADALTLGDHAALAGLVVRVRDDAKGPEWHTRKESFDHGVGTGLAFLGERAGARYGIVLTGWQVEHSTGAVVTSLALNAAGIINLPFAGNRFLAGVFDLASGELIWSDSIGGAEVLGVGSPDLRDPEFARKALSAVFESFAGPPALEPGQ